MYRMASKRIPMTGFGARHAPRRSPSARNRRADLSIRRNGLLRCRRQRAIQPSRGIAEPHAGTRQSVGASGENERHSDPVFCAAADNGSGLGDVHCVLEDPGDAWG